ncbi:Trehalose/maltose import ATP-binding protein MalK [uncultured archaeon]|nr:Trehalose/maltose import ATP-binding protein MalK [uncultured archaeon]
MEIKKLTIIGGHGKDGQPEPTREVTLKMGDIVSIVGPTGCGKTTLINDIELFANENTPSGRKVLINDGVPPEEFRADPYKNPIALISQHTNFLSDLPVKKFLEVHARIRKSDVQNVVNETVEFANQLTGEPLNVENSMTELSGGQTRALLIADAVIIGNSPIILLDEIENAGINRTKALQLLKNYQKIFIFVTHDPRIALLSDFRIAMGNGAMQKVILPENEEKVVAEELRKFDDVLTHFRDHIRKGDKLDKKMLDEYLATFAKSV